MSPITSGDFEVINLLRLDLENGWVYYIASPGKATQRYLFRSRLDGKGAPERLSPSGQAGHHSYNISPGCKYAVHTFTNYNTPTVYQIVSLPDHKVVRVLEDNSELRKDRKSVV